MTAANWSPFQGIATAFSVVSETPRIPLTHLTAAPDPTRRFSLIETVRRGLRERRFSRRTDEAYVRWIRVTSSIMDAVTRAISVSPR